MKYKQINFKIFHRNGSCGILSYITNTNAYTIPQGYKTTKGYNMLPCDRSSQSKEQLFFL